MLVSAARGASHIAALQRQLETISQLYSNPFNADPVKALHFAILVYQYGVEPFKQQQFGTAGVERVNNFSGPAFSACRPQVANDVSRREHS